MTRFTVWKFIDDWHKPCNYDGIDVLPTVTAKEPRQLSRDLYIYSLIPQVTKSPSLKKTNSKNVQKM